MQERVFRPWGSYTVLHEQEASHKVKLIEVSAGQRLSLQSHRLRAEHWFVVSGEGVVTLTMSHRARRSQDRAIDIRYRHASSDRMRPARGRCCSSKSSTVPLSMRMTSFATRMITEELQHRRL